MTYYNTSPAIASPTTAEEALDLWAVRMRATNRAERTIHERIRLIGSLEQRLDCSPLEFQTKQLSAFLALDFAPTTRFNYHVILRTWSRWLVDEGLREDDPTIPLGTPSLPKRRPRPASTPQVELLIAQGNLRGKTLTKVLLAAHQGLRVHEIAKIRGEDIDLELGRLYVCGKGGVVESLSLHATIRQEAAKYPRRGYWFPSPTNPDKPVHWQSVSKTLSHAFRRVGQPVTAHQLRHWHATELIAAGVPTRVVQRSMRHASIKTTEGYTDVSPTVAADAINRLPPLISA